MFAVLLVAVSLFAQAFGGTWTCHASSFVSQWSIQPAPGGNWSVVRWGPQDAADGGVAYVGLVPAQNTWSYDDFHYDGTYAVTSSKGPDKSGVWTWAGGSDYTPAGVMHGTITWRETSPTRIDRAYFLLGAGGKLRQTGSDYCTKT